MIYQYSYNAETRSFSMDWRKAKRVAGGISIAASAATAAIGLGRTLSDKSKFTVIYNTGAGPRQKVIKADSKNEALSKFNKSGTFNGVINSARAFRLPDEDQAANDYMNSLRSHSSSNKTTNSGKL